MEPVSFWDFNRELVLDSNGSDFCRRLDALYRSVCISRDIPIFEGSAYKSVLGSLTPADTLELIKDNSPFKEQIYTYFNISKNIRETDPGIVVLRSPYGYMVVNLMDFRRAKKVTNFSIQTSSESEKIVFEEFIKRYTTEIEDHSNACAVLLRGQKGYYLKYFEGTGTALIGDNYSPEIVLQYKKVLNDISNPVDPDGRLCIFQGPPGTGKTFLIQSLIAEMDQTINRIYVPLNFAGALDSPEILDVLISVKAENQNDDDYPQAAYSNDPRDYAEDQNVASMKSNAIVIIIEDCDSILIPRGGDNMSVISSLLNLTDGFLGKQLDIKIVASTNANLKEFDPAITRPGRLSELIKIDLLEAEHANRVYQRIRTKDSKDITYTKPVSLAEIYSDGKGKKIISKPVNKKGTAGF